METFAYVLATFSFLVAVVVGGVLSSKYVSIKDRPLIIAGPLLVGVCCAALPWFMNENNSEIIGVFFSLLLIIGTLSYGPYLVMLAGLLSVESNSDKATH